MTTPDFDSVARFSARAAAYDQYRWPFDQAAIAALLVAAGLRAGASVVDVGCGTGMSSLPFVRAGCRVTGIEPSAEMRRIAQRNLHGLGEFRGREGRAEATGLPTGFADLIVVGRALHWFPPAAARQEFGRVGKPGAWLAVMSVGSDDEALNEATQALRTEANGWDAHSGKAHRSAEAAAFFFDGDGYREITRPQIITETWEQFFGRLHTFSSSVTPDHPHYPRFEREARAVFEAFRRGDVLIIPTVTRILYGRVATTDH